MGKGEFFCRSYKIYILFDWTLCFVYVAQGGQPGLDYYNDDAGYLVEQENTAWTAFSE